MKIGLTREIRVFISPDLGRGKETVCTGFVCGDEATNQPKILRNSCRIWWESDGLGPYDRNTKWQRKRVRTRDKLAPTLAFHRNGPSWLAVLAREQCLSGATVQTATLHNESNGSDRASHR